MSNADEQLPESAPCIRDPSPAADGTARPNDDADDKVVVSVTVRTGLDTFADLERLTRELRLLGYDVSEDEFGEQLPDILAEISRNRVRCGVVVTPGKPREIWINKLLNSQPAASGNVKATDEDVYSTHLRQRLREHFQDRAIHRSARRRLWSRDSLTAWMSQRD